MKHLLTALPLIALTAGMAFAQAGPASPQIPTAEIAKDLGVTETQLTSCFGANRPQPGERKAPPKEATSGQRPEDRGLPTEILSCLQKANPKLTTERVQSVMQAHRPQPLQQN
ncbi:hypothetical protein [Celeribacter persicus]|jgi:hypothetical protein|uniref:Secreted protein n=1 Tax=Celeribacter persicus TaxID=1651082 RepID=A0A2T5HUP7_9RHOB|nr:hypothetical protein [Celeribacter persicus]PTQ75198.1 hypothetical protein C8N42_102115 [Celeribacter persicus]